MYLYITRQVCRMWWNKVGVYAIMIYRAYLMECTWWVRGNKITGCVDVTRVHSKQGIILPTVANVSWNPMDFYRNTGYTPVGKFLPTYLPIFMCVTYWVTIHIRWHKEIGTVFTCMRILRVWEFECRFDIVVSSSVPPWAHYKAGRINHPHNYDMVMNGRRKGTDVRGSWVVCLDLGRGYWMKGVTV